MPASPYDAKALGHQISAALGASQGGPAGGRPGALASSAMGPAAGPMPSPVTPPAGMFNFDPRRQAANLSFGMDEPQQAAASAPDAAMAAAMQEGLSARRAMKDRITQMLVQATGGMTVEDTLGDIGAAAARAVTGKTRFGDALSAMKAEKLAAAKDLGALLGQEERLELDREQVSLQKAEHRYRMLEEGRKRGFRRHTAILETINKLVPEEQRLAVMAKADEIAPYDIDETNVTRVISEAYRQLREAGELQAGPEMPFSGTSEYAQNQNILLTGSANSAEYRAAYNYMARPRAVYDAASGQTVITTPDMSAYQPPTGPSYGAAPGGTGAGGVSLARTGEPRLSMQDAQSLENLKMAERDIGIAHRLLFTVGEDGQLHFDPWVAAAARAPGGGLPGTDGRAAYQSMRRAIEVLLRLRTGAAAPQSEVDSYMDQFFPSPLDDDPQAARKIEAMQEFFTGTRQTFGASRGMNDASTDRPTNNGAGRTPAADAEKSTLDSLLGQP